MLDTHTRTQTAFLVGVSMSQRVPSAASGTATATANGDVFYERIAHTPRGPWRSNFRVVRQVKS